MYDRSFIVASSAAILFAVLVAPHAADACSLQHHTPLEIVDEEPEEEPPQTPDVELEDITRGSGPVSTGCGTQATSSCDDIGFVEVVIEDADPELGYEFAITDGELPEDFGRVDEPIHTREDGHITLTWGDGDTDDQEPLDFTLSVTAVDKWGQESESSATVEVEHPGSGRRAGIPGGLILAAAVLFGLGALRLRRADI